MVVYIIQEIDCGEDGDIYKNIFASLDKDVANQELQRLTAYQNARLKYNNLRNHYIEDIKVLNGFTKKWVALEKQWREYRDSIKNSIKSVCASRKEFDSKYGGTHGNDLEFMKLVHEWDAQNPFIFEGYETYADYELQVLDLH